MRVIVQRISEGHINIEGVPGPEIGHGLMVLLGIGADDGVEDVEWLVKKLTELRIFTDSDGKMNLSIRDVKGAFGVVSQFTLHAKTKKGTRPSFIHAAKPEIAEPLYQQFINQLRSTGFRVETGSFGANMDVVIVNQGPVTIWLDTKNKE
ncbi:MAG: D-tyrosyl-tRNA(Tyr) deacylase [Sphingobacteriales bacterium]|jgi:D-tyrosyl-tRNA(Tyr) deacylase